MKINRDDMLKTLEVARMAIAGSDHLEQLGHFIFEGENLVTFNNRLLIYYPFKTDFECSVDSDLFYKQLQKFDSEDLRVIQAKAHLVIKGKREKAKIRITKKKDSELFRVIETIRKEQLSVYYTDIPNDFLKAIDLCSFTASKNAADGTLCCIFIDGKTVMSTDNYRATRYVMEKSMSDEELLLDARIANEVKKFGMINFGVGDNWLHFKNADGVILSARRIFGDYMDIGSAFDVTGSPMTLPEKAINTLDFLTVILNQKQQLERNANIKIKDGLFTASVEDPRAILEKSTKFDTDEYNDLEMTFSVNIDFLSSVLGMTREIIHNVETGHAMFESDNFHHCIRLMPEIKTVEDAKEATQKEEEDVPF